jgi:hypothetical protein
MAIHSVDHKIPWKKLPTMGVSGELKIIPELRCLGCDLRLMGQKNAKMGIEGGDGNDRSRTSEMAKSRV